MKKLGDNANVSLIDATVFISDLHLCASRPHITSTFLQFLKNWVLQAKALFILGDLFDYWAGDDDIDDGHLQPIIDAFNALSNAGVSIYFMHGNRDFLVADAFCKAASITLLPDPTLIDLYGKRTILSHGDDLCTDDIAYQEFRRQVRDKRWQSDFLSKPLPLRKQQIQAIRQRSEKEKSQKSAHIMDVNQSAVNGLLVAHDYPELLIHGHTHRPHQHQIQLNGHTITRWVLGDWYEQGSYLFCNQDGCKSVGL